MTATNHRDPANRTVSLLTGEDISRFAQGRHTRLYDRLGSHPGNGGASSGAYFATWAPEAESVTVIGEFNGWDPGVDPMRPVGTSGIWEGYVADARRGDLYKYRIVPRRGGYPFDKADPLAGWAEGRPGTASRVWSPSYEWDDGSWMAERQSPHLA